MSHITVKSLTEIKANFLLSSLVDMLPKKSTGYDFFFDTSMLTIFYAVVIL